MQTAPQSNAMAEIALALAMAFFSVLVLTMVSMGAGFADASLAVPKSLPLQAAAVGSVKGTGASEVVSREALVIFYRGRFYDGALAARAPDANGQVQVLAVAPELSLSEAMAARDRLRPENITVTTLDPRWIEALERAQE